MTAASTCLIWLTGRSCGTLTPARRSVPHRRSRRGGSSSARWTAASSASGDHTPAGGLRRRTATRSRSHGCALSEAHRDRPPLATRPASVPRDRRRSPAGGDHRLAWSGKSRKARLIASRRRRSLLPELCVFHGYKSSLREPSIEGQLRRIDEIISDPDDPGSGMTIAFGRVPAEVHRQWQCVSDGAVGHRSLGYSAVVVAGAAAH